MKPSEPDSDEEIALIGEVQIPLNCWDFAQICRFPLVQQIVPFKLL
jgi:hypothetical protein